ncbi:MAG TPA: fibrobacter succinogenes major paralogous domain-containing protein, partial [Chitinophagaceae bacterium]|nr:fibrobacter succinogenes major paralogous domain-containing protein [Chitinophagaceae bacterium]
REIKTSNLTQATLLFPLKIKPGNNIYVFTAIDIKNNRASVSSEEYNYSRLQAKPIPVTTLPAAPTSVKPVKTWVKIGDQIWAIKNLNDSRFRNGDPIPEAKTAEEWERAGNNQQPAWCYYNNDPKIGNEFGKLYNWYAVNDPRGLAPILWHVATDAEWARLITYLGGEDIAGIKMKSKSWIDDDGTNESGFEGLPGGFRDYNGLFEDIGYGGFWWCSKEGEYTLRALESFYPGVNHGAGLNKKCGFSVRCIKD